MRRYYRNVRVEGYAKGEKGGMKLAAVETMLCDRDHDALQLAIRRNPAMPGCCKFYITEEEAFCTTQANVARKTREDIPKDTMINDEFNFKMVMDNRVLPFRTRKNDKPWWQDGA